MATAIVTDSNVSLPPSILEVVPIAIVPLEIHDKNRIYRDGIDITTSEFYALQRTADVLPTTSAPQPGAFLEAFTHAAKSTDEVICLTLSSHLSATYSAAIMARDAAAISLSHVRIEVVDSLCAGTAQGLIALAAGRMANDAATTDAILLNIDYWRTRVRLYGYLQSLYYVWRGGRVPRTLMWLGKLLDVKPVLELSEGKIGMIERPRTERRAMDRIVALAKSAAANDRVQIAVMHAAALNKAEVLAARLSDELAPDEVFITEFTPVIGAHTGPGLVGCAVLPLGPYS
jgi:DegV family protein with EDD domain